MDIKQQYEEACESYRLEFCKRYKMDIDYVEWDCDLDFLDVSCGTYILSLSEVRYMVDNNIAWSDFCEWYAYTLTLNLIDDKIATPNLMAWCKGCPRKTKEELAELERLHNNVINAKELLQEYIDKDKDELA